ncbi:FAD-dependent thymidylate synthase [Microtetraspora malaysiensis]|uniref:FAD-dependent thymidylate synthase n=1 Tax=Microtetraspora malaysiensis TaxID=161358 RepID=UPI003D8ADBFD
MRVKLVGWTDINPDAMAEVTDYVWMPDPFDMEADSLAVFAGRNCYQSWEAARPETADATGYLGNIIEQGHFSLFAHASATFYIDGVSRAFLTELNKHVFLKNSALSQRYVSPGDSEPVIPPALRGDEELERMLRAVWEDCTNDYAELVQYLTANGLPRKQAREAARAVLPNMAETRIVVTGNHLAWRDFIRQRWSVAADAEMREVAGEILGQLRRLAPDSYQDFPHDPFGSHLTAA